MSMGKLFGTDGVRGVANTDPMTPEMALMLGRATAFCSKTDRKRRHRIIVGKDTRISCAMLESALAAGVCSMGTDVYLAGTLPTPGIAFLTRSMEMDAGIMISASHNPFEDNGIKLFSRDGFKLPDDSEEEIERLAISADLMEPLPTGKDLGSIHCVSNAPSRYVEFCKDTFPEDLNLEGMKIVLDCANGATYKTAPEVFSSLGADVTVIHDSPDGTNINNNCGSQFTQDLSAKVRGLHADAGLAFDGDGDRLIAVDENGNELSGDQILAICGSMYRDRGLLRNNRIVLTVMSNLGIRDLFEKSGISLGIAPVGDRYVMELMQSSGAIMGGEASGHIIFLNHHTSGDGIVSALQLLATMRFRNRSLADLSEGIHLFPQKLINVEVTRKPPLESLEELQTAIRTAESELNRRGRVLIRYSGTQSLCRVMVEASTEETTDRLAASLADTVHRCIG